MSSEILKPNGQPLEYVPTVRWKDFVFPVRVLNEEVIRSADPKALIAGVLVQVSDGNNLLWAGLYALAKDIYSRSATEGSQEFLDFVDSMGLVLSDAHQNKIDVTEELRKILNKN